MDISIDFQKHEHAHAHTLTDSHCNRSTSFQGQLQQNELCHC